MQITLDKSDPAVQDMVSQWEDGGKYVITLLVTQDDGANAVFTVDGVEDYGEAMEPESEEDMMGEEPMMEGNMPPAAAAAIKSVTSQ